MSYVASIQIIHLPTLTHFYTVEETASSEREAREQFSKLAEVVSSMEKDNHCIVLETSEGVTMFTKKFLSDSILRLTLSHNEEETDDDAG